MCGIVFAASYQPVDRFVNAASALQQHRGPDAQDEITAIQGSCHLGFGHQRLAIVDLSANGEQPMQSASGRYTIILNGEIYNYRALRDQFGLTDLRSQSDTEVVLELIEKIGLDEALRHFNGMWAMVVWDRKTGKISLARDRFGKKPLVYLTRPDGIYVASEVKSFFALDDFDPQPDTAVSARFLSQLVQNADPATWVAGVQNVPAASVAEIYTDDLGAGLKNIRRFWEPQFDYTGDARTDAEYFEELRALVEDATKLRLHADVTVGIALSGGLDSSILAAISAKHQKTASQDTKLFSVVHPGQKDDESPFIDQIGAHLGLDIHKVSLDLERDGAQAAIDLIDHCNHHNDGPLSSLSSVLFYKLMEQAKAQGITVVLTGQGADEAFCGYRKFPALELKRQIKSGHWLQAMKFGGGFLANGTMLGQFNFAEAKRYLGAKNTSLLGEAAQQARQAEQISDMSRGLAHRQWADIARFSVPYLCHYEDRMSMAWAREVRSPFLDYRVVELGLQMPTHLKMHKGWTKYALRRAFDDQLPAGIAWRKDKKGFVNPETNWFRTDLRTRVEDVMGDPANPLYTNGLIRRDAYLDLYKLFCDGATNIWFRDIFAPFSLALWLNRWNGRSDPL